MKVVDRLSVLGRIDNRNDGRRHFVKIFRAAHFGERLVSFKEMLQSERAGHLSAFDQLRDRFVNTAMDRFIKIIRTQEIGDLLEGAIVGQNGAQQGGFDFRIVRRRAVNRSDRRIAVKTGDCGICIFHGQHEYRKFRSGGGVTSPLPEILSLMTVKPWAT